VVYRINIHHSHFASSKQDIFYIQYIILINKGAVPEMVLFKPHSAAQSSKMLPLLRNLIIVILFVFACVRFVHVISNMNEESFAAAAVSKLNDALMLKDAPAAAYASYIPGSAESYMMEHSSELGYNNANSAPMCPMWKNATEGTPSSVFNDLHSYLNELNHYNSLVDKFEPISDLRLRLHESDICKTRKSPIRRTSK
jgi:hypothetical protein